MRTTRRNTAAMRAAAMREQQNRYSTLARQIRATENAEIRTAAQRLLDDSLDYIIGTMHCPVRNQHLWIDAANTALDRVEAALA